MRIKDGDIEARGGCIGLMKAIDNFDITLNVKFSTYAVSMNFPWGNLLRNVENPLKSRFLDGVLLSRLKESDVYTALKIEYKVKNILNSTSL